MRAIVIGNATIDETLIVPRLPAAGETLLGEMAARDAGGKGLNQAVLLARAGLEVRFVARVGRDAEAAAVRACLAREDLTADLIEGVEPTDRSLILLDSAGENCIVSTAAAANAMTAAEAVAALADAAPGALLLLQGNLSLETTKAALKAARTRGFITVFNAAPVEHRFSSLWPLVTLAVVNEREAEQLTGSAGEAAARQIVAAGAEHAVVTLGARGALFANREGIEMRPAVAARAVDSTGAGDTFTAVLAAARFARGLAWPAALDAAAAAAAITIGARGALASFPSREALAAIFDGALMHR